MVLEEVFSPSLCSSDQSWSKDSGWGEIAQFGFLKFFENILKHKTKKYFWTSPDVENTRRCDEEAGESWPGILWSGRNPHSGRLRPPPRYCSMALNHVSLLQIKKGQIRSWSKRNKFLSLIFSENLMLEMMFLCITYNLQLHCVARMWNCIHLENNHSSIVNKWRSSWY